MGRNRISDALIAAACLIIAIAFIVLLFFQNLYIVSIVNCVPGANARFWLIATPVELEL